MTEFVGSTPLHTHAQRLLPNEMSMTVCKSLSLADLCKLADYSMDQELEIIGLHADRSCADGETLTGM